MLLHQANLTSVLSHSSYNTLLPAAAILRPHIGLIRRSRSHRQSRAYRIGSWSSVIDPLWKNEVQRQQQTMRRKSLEVLNQNLLWDRPRYSLHRPLFKSFMCSARAGRRSGHRWLNLEGEYFKKPQEGAATLEATAQTSINAILKTHNDMIDDMLRRKARIFGPNWYDDKTSAAGDPKGARPSRSSPISKGSAKENRDRSRAVHSTTEVDFEIDPITNRKVYKTKAITPSDLLRRAVELSNATSKAFLSQIQLVNPFASDPARESLKEYELKGKEDYSPVYYKEPDGKDPEIPCTVMAGLKEYDDKTSYSPVYYKEPDGRDPIQLCSVQQGLSEYDARVSYGPVYYKEPDGRDPAKICSVQEGLKAFDAKSPYGPVYYNEPDGKAPETECPVKKGLREYDAKITYGPLLYREPDGRLPDETCSVRSGLADFDTKGNYEYSASSIYTTPQKLVPPRNEKTEDLDLLRSCDVRAAAGKTGRNKTETDAEKSSQRERLERDFKDGQQKYLESLEIDRSELLNHVAHARARVDAKIKEIDAESALSTAPKITGNFVRDFPEEFAATWSKSDSQSGALTPNIKQGSTDRTTGSAAIPDTVMPEKSRLQTALDRGGDSTSKVTTIKSAVNPGVEEQSRRNRERQKHRELVQEIRQIYEDKYGVIDKNHRQASEFQNATKHDSASTPSESPTLYKILAYDPTMQSISEADTTSIVADSASPLTPAEVLLRLSNPAKFFPHFAPLQQQGFEILTGGGDVLVFRKVRDGAPLLPILEASTPIPEVRRRRLNPIDGMQAIAATGNFASPTGFVNHDLPQDEPESIDARSTFKSNIDVRRQEPVFSGKQNWEQGEKSRKSMGTKAKRIALGAFWVGACSYAIGVVAQFVKTH